MDDSHLQSAAYRADRQHSRRTVLRGVAAAGAVGAVSPLLSACGSGASEGQSDDESPAGGGGDGGGATDLPAASAVPVGGGIVVGKEQVVVTQPAKGTYKGFSAICTHAGCVLQDVKGGTINCDCHGSQFSIEDGSVVTGPATAPLPAKDISVKGDRISLA